MSILHLWFLPSKLTDKVARFVPQQTAWIVERMGKFHRILEPGLAILWPIIDKIKYVKSLKEAAIEIPSQSAITADNVTLEMDVSVNFCELVSRLIGANVGCVIYSSNRRLQSQVSLNFTV